MSSEEEFLKALQEDPSLINRLKKGSGLSDFKERYEVEKASPLKCPVCSALLQSPGTLWYKKEDPTYFVCRKCRLVFTLICHTIQNNELIDKLRQTSKDEGATLSWYGQEKTTEEE